ncbi:ankyrin repeat domain-containing protein [Maridesulfovibrio sp.]|uniref:ankyrin repeat domain-containing protein n=1 Tax=Maridesulfovibrio sp. TaxID=2795000 RepID=UPI0039EE84DC
MSKQYETIFHAIDASDISAVLSFFNDSFDFEDEIPPLAYAARTGNIEMVRAIHGAGYDWEAYYEIIDHISDCRGSALTDALRYGQHAIAEFLIGKGVDVNVMCFSSNVTAYPGIQNLEYEENCLSLALGLEFYHLLPLMVEKGLDLFDGFAMRRVIYAGDYYQVKRLLELGFDPNLTVTGDNTSIGDMSALTFALDCCIQNGFTPFYVEIVRLLKNAGATLIDTNISERFTVADSLQEGAPIEAFDLLSPESWSYLPNCFEDSESDIYNKQFGADEYSFDNIVLSNDTNVFETEYMNADKEIPLYRFQDRPGSPLSAAAALGYQHMCELLLIFDKDLRFPHSEAFPPLMMACMCENEGMIRFFIESGFELNEVYETTNRFGEKWITSALGIACQCCNIGVVEVLLESGADHFLPFNELRGLSEGNISSTNFAVEILKRDEELMLNGLQSRISESLRANDITEGFLFELCLTSNLKNALNFLLNEHLCANSKISVTVGSKKISTYPIVFACILKKAYAVEVLLNAGAVLGIIGDNESVYDNMLEVWPESRAIVQGWMEGRV